MSSAPPQYSEEDRQRIQVLLEQRLGKEDLCFRQGYGKTVAYVTVDKAAELANRAFGETGWSSTIRDVTVDAVDQDKTDGTWSASVSAVVRVHLTSGGCWHEDVGYGGAERCATKPAALENAKKKAASDGLKRALRLFGNLLGNSAYDDEYVSSLRKAAGPGGTQPGQL